MPNQDDFGLAASRAPGSEELFLYGMPFGSSGPPILASTSPPSFGFTEIAPVHPSEPTGLAFQMQADLGDNLYVLSQDGYLLEISESRLPT